MVKDVLSKKTEQTVNAYGMLLFRKWQWDSERWKSIVEFQWKETSDTQTKSKKQFHSGDFVTFLI